MSSFIHPAVTVSNIRNYIPITLEAENGQYTSWVELFKTHCRAFDVLDHIIPTAAAPPLPKPDDVAAAAATAAARAQWSRLDAIVLQWIYGTISKDLLITILSPNTTATAAWKALEHIFIDSKPSRAIHLKHRFTNAKLAAFPNMNAYCQEVKSIADQLANVDAPVDNDALVLQLIASLSEQFDGIATILQQTTPLPDFYTTHSKLCMEESRKASQSSPTALHTVANHKPYPTATLPPPAPIQWVRCNPFAPLVVANLNTHLGVVAALVVVVAADGTPTHPTRMAITLLSSPPLAHPTVADSSCPTPYSPIHTAHGRAALPTPSPNTQPRYTWP